MNDDKLKFERNINKQGGSLMFAVPPEVLDYLELKEGDVIELIADSKKKGKFAAFWKKV